jgi:hypothetical protein
MLTSRDVGKWLTGENSTWLWKEIDRLEGRFKNPLRKAKDPAWFLVDDIFNDLRAIPRRLMEEKTVDADSE